MVLWELFAPSSPDVRVEQSKEQSSTRTKEEIDSFLAQSMNQLSVQEREAAYEELHGITSGNPETPERTSLWLNALDNQLNHIKRTGSAYELAEAMDRSYVTSDKFRMMFLRADRYDVKKAASRMIKFMEIKKSLFGASKLTQRITLQDLDEDDFECLQNGSVQIPATRDIAGRPLCVGIPSLRNYRSIESELRARYYMLMSLTESEETQISGAIAIWYAVTPTVNTSTSSTNDERKYGSNSGLLWTLPIYWAAAHFCCDNFFVYVLSSAGILLSSAAQRMRVHYGNHDKCFAQLETFGIPRYGIPLNDQMGAHVHDHLSWVASREEQEMIAAGTEARAQSPMSPEVRPQDVLFGRGKGVHEHPGNINLRRLIASHEEAYDRASITERTEMALGIVAQIQRGGGRFLKHDATGWVEASTKESRAKITMAFRSQRKSKRGG